MVHSPCPVSDEALQVSLGQELEVFAVGHGLRPHPGPGLYHDLGVKDLQGLVQPGHQSVHIVLDCQVVWLDDRIFMGVTGPQFDEAS